MILDIYVDTREPDLLIDALNITVSYMNKGVQKDNPIKLNIVLTALEAGDLMCNNIIIERKSFTDAFESILARDGGVPRYRSQLFKLLGVKKEGKIPVVAIHDPMSSIDAVKRKAVITVMCKYFAAGIPVVAGFEDIHDFAWWCIRTFMYGGQKIQSFNIDLTKQVKATKASPTETLLRAIPGVGPKTAKAIADTGYTMYDLVSLTIPGISLIISGVEPTLDNIEYYQKKPYKVAKTIYDYFRGKSSTYHAEEWITFQDDDSSEDDENDVEDDLIFEEEED